MNNSLYIAATGMQAQQMSIDTIANNLTNVNTSGFKKGRVNFQEMMHVDGSASAQNPSATLNPVGLGIGIENVSRDFVAGALTQTNSPMDIAINGSGFIEVTLADGSRGYTRGGTLQVNQDSYLATSSGQVLRPGIHMPQNVTGITIGTDGKIMVQTGDQSQVSEVGQIELVNFSNPAGLKMVASGIYQPSANSGEATYGKPGAAGFGAIAQNTLEGSNVSLVDEMVTLMIAQRAYEMSSKIVQASDEMMSLTNNLRR
ncbi:flagellar basal-body rod protein FlgG (plasmid) [Undibacterium sp. YM2]|uniref:flagellar basal-body rod protein FlgG n=1 Tax=Undibacterium sp. YM2 TaxID=2058625 RepID=UPI001331C442|nr:flagellar basal-body rod protein FlgG [Undibacterium sp. YM2]BBB70253.1 flagellar basal-body rod protein FlgG [Undibacterium sp. YM2]